MVTFTAPICRFGSNKDKTGWTYVEIPPELAVQLHGKDKRAFRVQGMLDAHRIDHVTLMPMGGGAYMLTLNGPMRKAIRKGEGALLHLSLEIDLRPLPLSEDLLACLEDEPEARSFFESLSPSHKKYFSNWVNDAKTQETKVKRILKIIHALNQRQDYGTMIRENTGKGK